MTVAGGPERRARAAPPLPTAMPGAPADGAAPRSPAPDPTPAAGGAPPGPSGPGPGAEPRHPDATAQTAATGSGPGFGPSALATPANALSAGRLLAAPLFVGLIATEGASWVTVAVGVAVAGTDGVDGWLARRHGATTSGAFLDPLADKVLVLGSFFALAGQGYIPWLPVGLITVREVAMSAYRSWAGRRGVSIPARRSAKLKTIVQEVAIATCLVPPLADKGGLQVAAVWAATALTLSSGVQYVVDGRRRLRTETPR